MPQASSRVRSIAESDLHEALTLVGFVLCYTALMAVVVSSTTPFLSSNWASVWPFTLATAAVAALFIVGGLFVWPRLPTRDYEHRVSGFRKISLTSPRRKSWP
jgi:hypothetical protein